MESITLDSLNHKSEGLTERIEKLEKKCGVLSERKKLSEEVRAIYYKIQALERSGNPDPRLKKQYDEILSKYDKVVSISEEAEANQKLAFEELLKDLNSLVTIKGEKLAEKKIDGNIIDGIEAVNQGVEKALKKIFEELADTIKMIVSPEEWEEIAKALKEIMMNPIEFVENMIMFLKEEFGHIVRDIGVIKDNSTTSGLAVEMGQYIPETCLPLIISSIGQGKIVKFLKYIKADKLIPEKLMKKLEGMGKEKKIGNKTEDLLKHNNTDWNFKFLDFNKPIGNIVKDMDIIARDLDITRLLGMEGRLEMVLKTMDDLSEYVIGNTEKILESTSKKQFIENFIDLRKKLVKIAGSDTLKSGDLTRMNFIIENRLNPALEQLLPHIAPKQ